MFSILVVDDEADNFDVIETLLSAGDAHSPERDLTEIPSLRQRQDYQLHYAASGKVAIASLETLNPDLILLDAMMQDMDGFQVCQHIRASPKWSAVPIIMVTALTTKRDLAQCFAVGADDFISKPVNRLELQARVRSMLRIRQLHHTLEERVIQRTTELNDTNIRLEQQIQERLLAEKTLRYHEGRFRALIENASDLILLLTSEGQIRYVSPSVDRNLGYLPNTFLGQHFTQWVHPEDQEKAVNFIQGIFTQQARDLSLELRWQHQEGHWLICETIAQSYIDITGFSGIVLNVRDITERLHIGTMERSLQREQELSEHKLRFFAMTSHEFRTPLSVILMSAQILETSEPERLNSKQLKNIQRIHDSAKHLKQMLADVLDIARLEAQQMEYKPEPINLRKLCDRILANFNASDNGKHPIFYDYQGPSDQIFLDPHLTHSILTNLLSNAIKYSAPGQPVQFEITQTLNTVEFKISDQGIGIPLAEQVHLFKAFQRSSNVGEVEGSGLGLTIVKKSVDIQGGDILVHSIENQGSTVTVRLPLKPLE